MMASSLKNSQLNFAAGTERSVPSVRLASPTAPARSSARVWSSVTDRYSAGAAFHASRSLTTAESTRREMARQPSSAAALSAAAAACSTSKRTSAAHSARSLKSRARSAACSAARDVSRAALAAAITACVEAIRGRKGGARGFGGGR